MLKTITIPKQMTAKGDLVIIPRKEYESLLRLHMRTIQEFTPTLAQKNDLQRAERNLNKKKTLSVQEFTHALGITN